MNTSEKDLEAIAELEEDESSRVLVDAHRIGEITAQNIYITHSLDKLSQADPGEIQKIAASQIELLNSYYNTGLYHAKLSFRFAAPPVRQECVAASRRKTPHMKRDPDLIRKIILAVEDLPTGLVLDKIKIDGYTREQIGYHSYLIVDSGLAQLPFAPSDISVSRLRRGSKERNFLEQGPEYCQE